MDLSQFEMPVFPMDFSQFQVQAVPARDGGDGPGPGVSRKEKDSNGTNVVKLKTVSKTTKGAPLYIDEQNYEYIKNREQITPYGKQTNVLCAEYFRQKCKSVGRVYDWKQDTITVLVDHNHVADAADVSAKLLVRKYVESAVANPTVEPRTAYAQMLASRKLLATERMCIPDRVFEPMTFNIWNTL